MERMERPSDGMTGREHRDLRVGKALRSMRGFTLLKDITVYLSILIHDGPATEYPTLTFLFSGLIFGFPDNAVIIKSTAGPDVMRIAEW